jgi:hypothetical protein
VSFILALLASSVGSHFEHVLRCKRRANHYRVSLPAQLRGV